MVLFSSVSFDKSPHLEFDEIFDLCEQANVCVPIELDLTLARGFWRKGIEVQLAMGTGITQSSVIQIKPPKSWGTTNVFSKTTNIEIQYVTVLID